jgi:glycosidase
MPPMRSSDRSRAPIAAVLLLIAPFAVAAPVVAEPAPPWRLDWAEGATFYEIFVRSFADSDGDGIGDFRGLTDRLDYLNDGDSATTTDLGVEGLWLMPVFASPSYHGYDVTDYERVNPEYGTEQDFDRLLAECRRRGIRVIVDLVMNHTSVRHPWFIEASGDTASPRRHWYVWRDEDPGWGQPWNPAGSSWHRGEHGWYYGLFWSGMPDLNFRHPAVRSEMLRIADAWLARGVDGFRLDATRHLIETGPGSGQSDAEETHAFLRELSAHVRRVKPDALLVGENWTDAMAIADYFGSADSVARGDGLPCNFDFPLAGAIVDGLRAGDARGIVRAVAEAHRLYPDGALDATFLTNHDMPRLATQLGGAAGRLAAAAAVLLTLPGTPFLYYGEEVGLENGPGRDDQFKRTPMPWDSSPNGGFTRGTPWFGFAPGRERANVAAQNGKPGSLLERYRSLIRLRGSQPALRRGDLVLLTPDGPPSPVLAFTRGAGGERLLVVHNLGSRRVESEPLALGPEAGALAPLMLDPGVRARLQGGAATVTLPPYGCGVWRVGERRR